jgi:hypothetical protein
MNRAVTLEFSVSFGRKPVSGRPIVLPADPAPTEVAVSPTRGRVPRIARLMALAIRIEGLIQEGTVADYAEAARLGHITRARMTQVMNLLGLAPDIQEELLHLPLTLAGRDPIGERELRSIASIISWARQRQMWHRAKQALRPVVTSSRAKGCSGAPYS